MNMATKLLGLGLCAALAGCLGVPLAPSPTVAPERDEVERVGAALATRGPTVVVLDNFEQLSIWAPQTVGRWLEVAPELRLVVTSRVHLGLPSDVGEVLVSTLVPLARGPAARAMLRFGTRLPVTDSEVGLGRDQTDFFALVGARAARGGTSIGAEAGLGIHGTHSRGYYEQVDVLLYAVELEQRLGWLRASAALLGQLDGLSGPSVRGNEDLQEARLGLRAGGRRWSWSTAFARSAPGRGCGSWAAAAGRSPAQSRASA